MAFAITIGDSLQPAVYATKVEIADQSATPGTGSDLLKKYNKFRAFVHLKAAGAASVVSLEVADDAGFTSNVRIIARVSFVITAIQSAVLEGVAADGAKQFARITQVGAGTLDARIQAGL